MTDIEATDIEANKRTVVAYQMAFEGNPEKAVADYFGDRYIPHNPEAQDGPEAFIGFVHYLRSEYPELRLDIKRVIAEGNLVVTHSHLVSYLASQGGRWPTSFAWRTARSSSTGM